MNTLEQYKVIKSSDLEPKATAGTIVFELRGCDYGLAADDTYMLNIEHISVTLKSNGDYPSFTIPIADIERIMFD